MQHRACAYTTSYSTCTTAAQKGVYFFERRYASILSIPSFNTSILRTYEILMLPRPPAPKSVPGSTATPASCNNAVDSSSQVLQDDLGCTVTSNRPPRWCQWRPCCNQRHARTHAHSRARTLARTLVHTRGWVEEEKKKEIIKVTHARLLVISFKNYAVEHTMMQCMEGQHAAKNVEHPITWRRAFQPGAMHLKKLLCISFLK